MANYYEILEVNEKASIEVIDKAYKALAKKYHPDIYEGDKKDAEKKMQQLNEAYDVLSNEEKRKNYDTVLERKRQLQRAKEEVSRSQNNTAHNISNTGSSHVSNMQDENIQDSPINNPAKYDRDKFVVDTTYMDEKQKKKIQKKLQERYIEAYDNYLRSRGYKLKYKWTLKRIGITALVIISIILLFTILFFIPPIHNYLVNLYNTNVVLKFFVDIIIAFFSAIFSTISQLF